MNYGVPMINYKHDYCCFTVGGIFSVSYRIIGPNIYNFHLYPEGTYKNLGLDMRGF